MSSTNIYYMLQQKREQFHRGIQKQDRERLFQRIRLQLLSSTEEKGRTVSQDGQQQILDSIAHFINQQQPLDFQAINHYICSFEHPFRQDLVDQFLPLVVQKFPSNNRALACAANLLSKCEQNDVVDRMDLPHCLSGLLKANKDEENSSNFRPLLFLIYQMFTFASEKSAFSIIPEHYERMIRILGQFDVIILLLLEQASTRRQLLPSQAVMESYLSQDIPYGSVTEVGVCKLFGMIDNFLRFDQTCLLYQPASLWIERRLRERDFPIKYKPNLVRLMTMMLNSLEGTGSTYIDFLSKLSVFRQILYLARFGNMHCKPPSLEFLATLVSVASPQLLIHYAEEHQLLEVLVYALELDLEEELAFKVLTGIGLIIGASGRHIRKALQLGLGTILGKFEDCSHQKRIVELSFCLQQILAQQRLCRNL